MMLCQNVLAAMAHSGRCGVPNWRPWCECKAAVEQALIALVRARA